MVIIYLRLYTHSGILEATKAYATEEEFLADKQAFFDEHASDLSEDDNLSALAINLETLVVEELPQEAGNELIDRALGLEEDDE